MFRLNDNIMSLLDGYDNKDEIIETLQHLSPDEEIAVLANIIGFESVPVDIETFVKDPYYLGNIYGETIFPIWLERLKEVYPDPIRTTGTFLSVGGAIGVGKSRFSTIVSLYDYYKFSLIKDPTKFLRLDPTTVYVNRYFNVSMAKAKETFIDPIETAFSLSPYFKELHARLGGKYGHGIRFKTGSKPKHALSEAIITCVISEVNFFEKGMALDLIATIASRLDSRMQMGMGILNHVILDSSDTEEDSAVEDFIRNSPYSNELIRYTTNIWQAKGHLGIYFNHGSFKIYAGDSELAPFIFDETKTYDSEKLDPDRIIVCPNEVRSAFELDINKAIQEKIGLSTMSSNAFFPDKIRAKDCFVLNHEIEDIIIVDFFDKETVMSKVKKEVDKLPLERKLYVHIDMGVSGDICGIAITHFDGKKQIEVDKEKKYVSTFKTPICFGLSRKVGQETPINKVRDFLITLDKFREIALVTTDTYQSTQLRQELIQAKLNAKVQSVDRTDIPYNTIKNLILQDRVKVAKCERALHELLTLKRVGRKVDHPENSSKDIMDAVCGSIYGAYMDGDKAADLPRQYTDVRYANVISSIKAGKTNIQRALQNTQNLWG